MKAFFYCMILVLFSGAASAQGYTPLNTGSTIHFKIKNFGFNVSGSFTGIKGVIHFDETDLSSAAFDISLDANTINTDNDQRDNHLREETYFDVKNYPEIHFVSSKITASDKKGGFVIYGKLTIKKTTKEISFPFTAQSGSEGYQFDGEFNINRKDYGVGGSSTLSDNVAVSLHVLSKK